MDDRVNRKNETTLDREDLLNVLAVTQAGSVCQSAEQLRQVMISGVNSLVDCLFVAWTEIEIDRVACEARDGGTFEMSKDEETLEDLIPVFLRYLPEHPIISRFATNPVDNPISISDYLDRASFNAMDVYDNFYQLSNVEDQLCCGRITSGGVIFGVSVQRDSWGFTQRERELVGRVCDSLLPQYQRMMTHSRLTFIEMCTKNIATQAVEIGLSKRESEILALISTGKSNKQIADTTGISDGTVRKHLENCYLKLGVNNRVSAVLVALNRIRGTGSE